MHSPAHPAPGLPLQPPGGARAHPLGRHAAEDPPLTPGGAGIPGGPPQRRPRPVLRVRAALRRAGGQHSRRGQCCPRRRCSAHERPDRRAGPGALGEAQPYDAGRSGLEAMRSGSGRPLVGGLSAGGREPASPASLEKTSGFPDPATQSLENAHPGQVAEGPRLEPYPQRPAAGTGG